MKNKTDLISSVCIRLLNGDSESALIELSEWPPPAISSFKKSGVSDLYKIRTFKRD